MVAPRILGKKVLYNIAAKEDVEHGEELMDRYGLLAVFIGGITPIPGRQCDTHRPDEAILRSQLTDGISGNACNQIDNSAVCIFRFCCF